MKRFLKTAVVTFLALTMILSVIPVNANAKDEDLDDYGEIVYYSGCCFKFPKNSWVYSPMLSTSTSGKGAMMYFSPDTTIDLSVDTSDADSTRDNSNFSILYLAKFDADKKALPSELKAIEDKFGADIKKEGSMFERDTYRLRVSPQTAGQKNGYIMDGIVLFPTKSKGLLLLIQGNEKDTAGYAQMIDDLYRPGYTFKTGAQKKGVYKERWAKRLARKSDDGRIFWAGRYPKVKIRVKSCKRKKDDNCYILKSTGNVMYQTTRKYKKGQTIEVRLTAMEEKDRKLYGSIYY